MEKAFYIMKTIKFNMKEILKMKNLMDMENIIMKMENFIMENGIMVRN